MVFYNYTKIEGIERRYGLIQYYMIVIEYCCIVRQHNHRQYPFQWKG